MSDDHSECGPDKDLYYRQLLSSAAMAVMAVDHDMKVVYCNGRAAELFGCPVKKLTGLTLGEIIGPERRHVIETLTQRAIEHGEYHEFEFRHETIPSLPRFLAVTISPICDPHGQPIGASTCIRDITRRIQLQEQLSQSRKMRALGVMAGNLAHHFNNILGSVVTGVDFARNSNDVRTLKRTLSNTAGALQRATQLLNGLLAFAEADYSDSDLADLTETVLYFVNQIESDLTQHRITLDLKLHEIPVMAVPMNQFMTVLRHLVGNAIDAMPDGGRLTLELEPQNQQVICRITDSGHGIEPKDLGRVFEPFYSTKELEEASAENRAQHHGLGLSVAMGIIHELGGTISITSQPGESTLVEIRLPVDPSRRLKPLVDDLEDLSLHPTEPPPKT